jgi:hypothetical protein
MELGRFTGDHQRQGNRKTAMADYPPRRKGKAMDGRAEVLGHFLPKNLFAQNNKNPREPIAPRASLSSVIPSHRPAFSGLKEQ